MVPFFVDLGVPTGTIIIFKKIDILSEPEHRVPTPSTDIEPEYRHRRYLAWSGTWVRMIPDIYLHSITPDTFTYMDGKMQ